MPIWQLCENLLIPNCLRSNLSYSPLAALELYVMKDKSKTSIVIGELIKRELKKQGKTSVWLAGELGCHRTNVYKIYDRSTIDSGMLFHISQLLKVDFFKLYSDALKKKL